MEHKTWFRETGVHVLIVIVVIVFALIMEKISKQDDNISGIQKEVKGTRKDIHGILERIEKGFEVEMKGK